MTLSLNTGAVATYDAAASRPGQAYVFKYTVKDDEVASDLSIISVNLNGAVLRDAEGKDALISSDLSLMSGTLKVNGYIGSAGNENFYGTSGAETFEGRGGDDIYRINNVGDRVIERKGDGHDTIVATLDFALAEGVEVETIRAAKSIGAADIKLTGNAFAQTLEGTEGRNVLDGRGGADIMRGKGGDDRYYVDSARDVVIEERGGGFDTILTSVSFALAAGLEIEALEIADPAKSSGSTVRLTGNEFANRLTGDRGDNVLDGGGGIDIMRGLGGNDTYTVDKARDQVIEAKGGGTDTVVTTVSYALTAGQEIEALQLAASTGSANLNLTGNEYGQTLIGNAGANRIDGGGGIDIMRGLGGNDTYTLDKARDQVIEAKGGGTDTVVTTVSYALTAGQEIEALQLAASTGQANLNLTGNEFANAIRGNDGNNVLDGSSGSDILTGRAGLDAFVFSTKLGAGNVDRITDFAPVDDTIRLSEDIFTALGAGPLRAAAFKDLSVAGAKVDASDRILYDRDTGALSYDADGSGTAKAIKFAVLDNHAKLTHDDFFVV
ncbi:calcium-binding protein [Methylorubrum salsuginis]|uniref:Ca2+-binding protein, RTX toxin-related n=1 Tax=Methylorubrum salsuginis TaxID=414703 RepID=A0A1I4DG79_9HYPH|nr:calcium-binding protein [Methylorubrum salsuginis]SFK92215.1 Ca2+-binding protein, RTX toxin-related [Methylorubrum salsuginis]